jgi:hypothetical protein
VNGEGGVAADLRRDGPDAWRWLAVGGSAFVLAPTLGWGLCYDHGIAHYLAWMALDGRWPYADALAFPGAVLLHMLAIALGGASGLPLRVLDWGAQTGSAALIFTLTDRLAGPRAGALAAVLYASGYVATGPCQTAQRDGFLVPLLLLAVWCLDHHARSPRPRWPVLAGIAAGFACLFRPTYVVAAAVAAGWLLAWPRPQARRFGPRVRDVLAFAVPCGLPLGLFIGIYIWRGEGPMLRDMATFMATVYAHLERYSVWQLLVGPLDRAPEMLSLGAALSVLSPERRQQPWRYGAWLLILGTGILIRLLEAKGYPYQYWPVIAGAAVLAGVGWNFALAAVLRAAAVAPHRVPLVTGLATALLVAWCPLVSNRRLLPEYWHLVPRLQESLAESPAYRSLIGDDIEQAEVARYVREHTAPGDTIQTWGTVAMLYYAAGRFAATRAFTTNMFLCSEEGTGGGAAVARERFFTDCTRHRNVPLQDRYRREFLAAVDRNRPAVIVAHYADGSLAVTRGVSAAPDFPDLRAIIDRDYELERTFRTLSVFRRRS